MKQYKTILFSLGIIGIFLAILVFAARGPKNTQANINGSASPLTATETTYDFGTVSMAAGNVSHQFAVKNSGTEPVTVRRIFTSCMCTTATLDNGGERSGPFGMPGHSALPDISQVIAPGQQAFLDVIFDPAAHGPAGVGRISRTVSVQDDQGRALQIGFQAVVTP